MNKKKRESLPGGRDAATCVPIVLTPLMSLSHSLAQYLTPPSLRAHSLPWLTRGRASRSLLLACRYIYAGALRRRHTLRYCQHTDTQAAAAARISRTYIYTYIINTSRAHLFCLLSASHHRNIAAAAASTTLRSWFLYYYTATVHVYLRL